MLDYNLETNDTLPFSVKELGDPYPSRRPRHTRGNASKEGKDVYFCSKWRDTQSWHPAKQHEDAVCLVDLYTLTYILESLSVDTRNPKVAGQVHFVPHMYVFGIYLPTGSL